jgi:hypothetical protein
MKRLAVGLSAFIILAALFVSGCQTRINDIVNDDNTDHLEPLSTQLDIDIYIDATKSMEGFVTPGYSTYYAQILRLLESASTTGWANSNVKFFEFGSDITPLPGRDYLKATRGDFYITKAYSKETYIEKVLRHAQSEHLTIIVTDLFQHNSDVNLLSGLLKDRYLKNNLAVGILGIRSEFNGEVYDIGPNRDHFPYKHIDLNKPEALRPFYILVLGKYADIEHYYQKLLLSGLKDYPEEIREFVIFSPFLANPLASFENGKMETDSNLAATSGILAQGIRDRRSKQFNLQNKTAKSTFKATFSYFPLDHSMLFNRSAIDSSGISSEINAWKYQTGQSRTVSNLSPSNEQNKNSEKGEGNKRIENLEAKRCLEISMVELNDSKLKLEGQLAAGSLPGDGVYCFEVILRPNNYKLPDWVSKWDMDTRLLEHWLQNKADFNGATTLNLRAFLNDLLETTVELHRPKLAKFYLYVRR